MRSLTREFYIPKGATKVADKKSDAVAYLHEHAGKPCAVIFYGRQAKPVGRYQYRSPSEREAHVMRSFAQREDMTRRQSERRQQRKATGRGVEVGTILYASWGYEQTNVNFYRVAKLVGSTMAELEELDAISVGAPDRPWATDKVVPGEEGNGHIHRVVIRAGRATVDGHYCSVWDGRPLHTSSYA